MADAELCPWCKYNPYFPGCDADGDCDFRDLKYEKDAILARLRDENAAIKKFKERIIAGKFKGDVEKEAAKVVDVAKGMQIMVDRLSADFGMDAADARAHGGFEALSALNRVKLYARMVKLKKERGKKRGNREGN